MNLFSRILVVLFVTIFGAAHAEDAAETKAEPKLAITTNAFLDKMAIPTLYTCDGKDVSPQLAWSDLPPKTASLVMIMKDIDAPGGTFYHWVIYNMPKATTELAQGASAPNGASIGKNNFDKTAYTGPCPPKGDAHTYIFTLYALDTTLKLPKEADAPSVLTAMKDHILGQVDLTGVYSRWIQ